MLIMPQVLKIKHIGDKLPLNEQQQCEELYTHYRPWAEEKSYPYNKRIFN